MNWNNLKSNKCPKCDSDLSDKFVETRHKSDCYFKCICGFTISSRKFKELISRTYKPKFEQPYRPEDENPE